MTSCCRKTDDRWENDAPYKTQEALESFASPDYFRGNRILLNNSIIRMAAKSPFCLPSILLPEAMDQSETPLILKLRPSSVYQGAIHQFWSIIFDDTWRQSKGVKLGISKIANYNSSWYYCRPKKLNPFDLAYFEDPHAEISFKNVVKWTSKMTVLSTMLWTNSDFICHRQKTRN